MRILFVTSTRIGDAVLSTGLLDHLVRTYPEAQFTIACGPVAAPLFEAVPRLARLIVLRKLPYARHWLEFLGQTMGSFWDIIVDLRGSVATMALFRSHRYAYYTDRAPVHRLVKLSEVLKLDRPAAPKLWTAPAHEAEAERRVGEAHVGAHGGEDIPVLALGPTANWPCKEWPVENFIELARRLTGPKGPLADARIMVLGGPGEHAAARPLIAAFPPARIIEIFDGVSLLTAFACLRRAGLYVGNDSGLMHMAAAAGIPTLGLFGPTQDAHYAPFGPNCAVVRTPESYEELNGSAKRMEKPGSLMGGLTVDAVEHGARDLVARTRGAG
ncbi:MAG: glycosyltransferase family 9 protein [Alphaproteobacteria bacterium]|nr:glycosyltransferase family 9 protein [Pseudomonadota bacterium]TDI68523.1 MAG: glycosyltransferase family 9 protein [Alphaproteobacteria bacterium]